MKQMTFKITQLVTVECDDDTLPSDIHSIIEVDTKDEDDESKVELVVERDETEVEFISEANL